MYCSHLFSLRECGILLRVCVCVFVFVLPHTYIGEYAFVCVCVSATAVAGLLEMLQMTKALTLREDQSLADYCVHQGEDTEEVGHRSPCLGGVLPFSPPPAIWCVCVCVCLFCMFVCVSCHNSLVFVSRARLRCV